MEGIQLAVTGFPARFCNSHAALDTVCTHSLGNFGDSLTWVVTGIDAFVDPLGLQGDAWYAINDPSRKIRFGEWALDNPSNASDVPEDPLRGLIAQWRGAIPFCGTDTIEIGVESASFCEMGITAWGYWIPHNMVSPFAAP